jgi:AAA15 family ATPase/GTPase
MSFQDEATLDLVATKEEQHANHFFLAKRYNLKVLPVAAIYGANASGKSNLTTALHFAKSFVIAPPKAGARIAVVPFLLGSDSKPSPTEFCFELLLDQTVYRYEFSISSSRVEHEALFELRPNSEIPLFVRNAEKFELSDKLKKANEGLWFALQGTQENQLFITNSVSQKNSEFRPIFDWFDNALTVISPDTHYGRLPDIANMKHPFASEITKWLIDLDTGIHTIRPEDIQTEYPLPQRLLETIAADLKEGETFWLSQLGEAEGDYVDIKSGKPVIRRLTPIHRKSTGEEIPFRFSYESDGTRRLLDLLPAFIILNHSSHLSTFVIDELDRSLHSNLTRALIEHFLAHRKSTSRAQLIFTTHDTELMSQSIFRRDEIWITERDRNGASTLTAFSEFKDVRKDKDIRKSYLQGRLGGVPRIQETADLCSDKVG